MPDASGMPQLQEALSLLLIAIPNPMQWSGSAALACSAAIEALADDLRSMQAQLGFDLVDSGW